MDDGDWSRLLEQLEEGECTPFLGAGACDPTLPMGGDLSESWAARCSYPFTDLRNLPRVMQYMAISAHEYVIVKQRVCKEITEKGLPDFTDSSEPHALLAEFPLSVYLTTNYDNFMVSALEQAGKDPYPAICPWYKNAPPSGIEDLMPDDHKPIVYYLHGRCKDDNARSLVLTEADYLEFLVNLAMDHVADKRLIPTSILSSFTEWPLLFIGYSLQDWTFQVIYHSLRYTVAETNQRRHVSVQLPPLPNNESDARKRAETYLKTHFEKWNISVYWGTAREFCAELRSRREQA